METLKKEILSIYDDLSINKDTLNIRLNILNQFKDYLLKEGINKGIIGKKEKDKIISRHLFDSVSILKIKKIQNIYVNSNCLADFGTGGGLPGIVIAICFPLNKIILFDSSTKRMSFIRDFINLLNQSGTTKALNLKKKIVLEADRIESKTLIKKYKNKIDLAFSRAFLPVGISLELIYPYLTNNAYYINYVGPSFNDILPAVKNKIEESSFKLSSIENIPCSYEENTRNIALFHKKGNTNNNWPRSLKIIKNEWDNMI